MIQTSFFDGFAERNRILAEMGGNHKIYLTSLRSFARVIAMREGEVSIDALRAEMERREFPFPKQIGADNRVFGTVFNTKEFVPVRQVVTTRKERVARSGRGASYVTVYRMATE